MFIYKTGLYCDFITDFTNFHIVQLFLHYPEIKINNIRTFHPLYSNEFLRFILAISKLNAKKIQLLYKGVLQHFFETSTKTTYKNFLALLAHEGYKIPTGVGLHTIRYLYCETLVDDNLKKKYKRTISKY